MALQIKKTLDKGIVADQCYAKIFGVKYLDPLGEDTIPEISLQVAYYFSEEARRFDVMEYAKIETIKMKVRDSPLETRAEQYKELKKTEDRDGVMVPVYGDGFDDATDLL